MLHPIRSWMLIAIRMTLQALTPSHAVSPLGLSGIDRSFGNGTLYTWTAGLERAFGTLTADVIYVGTAGVKLPRTSFPNAYPGAGPEFARYRAVRTFRASESAASASSVITASSPLPAITRSKPHSPETLVMADRTSKLYTWAESISDNIYLAVWEQPARRRRPTRRTLSILTLKRVHRPSNIGHAFFECRAGSSSRRLGGFLHRVLRRLTGGWQIMGISTITSSNTFTVYSGVQQAPVLTELIVRMR